MKKEISAMRIAGIACGITLAIIAYFVFTMPSVEFVDQLTHIGEFWGGGTTYGVLALAALPTAIGFLSYFVWKWLNK